MKKERQSWDDYFLDMAKVASKRGTCDRAHVGAVIVKDRYIISTGYNGSLPGAPHCDDVGHLIVKGHCKRTTHAEVSAITQAAYQGVSIKDTSIYITHNPCLECFRSIVASGIRRIYFIETYNLDKKAVDLYKVVSGYKTIDVGNETDKVYNWEIDLTSKVWYKI